MFVSVFDGQVPIPNVHAGKGAKRNNFFETSFGVAFLVEPNQSSRIWLATARDSVPGVGWLQYFSKCLFRFWAHVALRKIAQGN